MYDVATYLLGRADFCFYNYHIKVLVSKEKGPHSFEGAFPHNSKLDVG